MKKRVRRPPPPPRPQARDVEVVRIQRGQSRRQAAAEFIWGYRRDLHRAGVKLFDLPAGHALPVWLAIVFEQLRASRGKWRVDELHPLDFRGIRYRVRWLHWRKGRPS
jgi:hypothetical protein